MKIKLNQLLICLVVFFGNLLTETVFATVHDTLTASNLHPYGRNWKSANGNLELISSAVHFGFQFEGKTCTIYANINKGNGHNYLQYTLDGIYQKRLKIMGDTLRPISIGGLTNRKHTIWIYKATEAHTGPVFIEKIIANHILAINNLRRPLVEFIGNSITCGAAADPSEIPCGTGEYHDQHNAYYAYGPRLARMLNVNFILSSVSGVGIYRNWNTDGPAMPKLFEKADFQENSARPWDFKSYHPEIVSIALGTNDFSDGDGIHARKPFDSAIFVNEYVQFVQLVKSKYPYARIVLLSSPMIHGLKREILQNCMSEVKKMIDQKFPEAKTVALFFFKPMNARGCGGHPNLEDHAIMAAELLPFFRKLI